MHFNSFSPPVHHILMFDERSAALHCYSNWILDVKTPIGLDFVLLASEISSS